MKNLKWVLIALTFTLPGCAAIVDGRKQEVQVQTPGIGCAQCQLSNSKGTYQSSCTPQKVTVKRAYGPLSVSCQAPGWSGKSESESKVKGWFFGNILLGGLIGMGIDAATGAAYDYPDTIQVQMQQQAAALRPQHVAPAATNQPAQVNPARAPRPATYPHNMNASGGYKPLYAPSQPVKAAPR
jgi:hypothetical protein